MFRVYWLAGGRTSWRWFTDSDKATAFFARMHLWTGGNAWSDGFAY